MLLRPSGEQKKGRFFTWFERSFDKVTKGYMGIIHRVLRKGGAMMGAFAVMLVLMLLGFSSIPGGFVPGEDEGYFFVDAELPAGASLERAEEVMDRVNQILLETPTRSCWRPRAWST
jgi:multidrug efflux pump subunit AcrB